MNRPKIEFITYINTFYIISQVSVFNFKLQISTLNVMEIHVQRHANVSKQIILLDGVDVGPPKWPVGGRG